MLLSCKSHPPFDHKGSRGGIPTIISDTVLETPVVLTFSFTFPCHIYICFIMSTISVKIEFGGGLELLFSNERTHKIALPTHIPASSPAATADAPDAPANITFLIYWLKENLLKERAELFEEKGTVCVLLAETKQKILMRV